MGRAELTNLPPELIGNVNTIVPRANLLLAHFKEYRPCRSGYRTPESNTAAGGKVRSNHLTCQAIDLEDTDRKLSVWCLLNLKLLEEVGVWMESPSSTPTWIHWQCVPPKSGNRVFRP